ncbi:MAG: hypothetical protein LQ339_000175 [Xanthoria mediterranea]|nr:MAG: hypothetical protein LQ339_000175 [Xanthoria mediterranea]
MGGTPTLQALSLPSTRLWYRPKGCRSTKNLTVEDLHGLLSQRLPNVPDIAIFCATFGVPCNALVIATTKPTKAHKAKKVKTKSAKPNAPPVDAKSKSRKQETQWLPDDESRTLFISVPETKCHAPIQQEIQVETFHAEASKETRNFSLASAPKRSSFGLPVRFPTQQMHDAASHNLRTHLLKYNEDDGAFQLNVAETYFPPRLVIPVVEISTEDALSLLGIVVRFFPVGRSASASKQVIARGCCYDSNVAARENENERTINECIFIGEVHHQMYQLSAEGGDHRVRPTKRFAKILARKRLGIYRPGEPKGEVQLSFRWVIIYVGDHRHLRCKSQFVQPRKTRCIPKNNGSMIMNDAFTVTTLPLLRVAVSE